MRRFVPLFLLTAVLVGCSPHAAESVHIARIEHHLIAPKYAPKVPLGKDSIAERMAYWHVPGVSVAVIDQGKVVWAKGFGVADLASGQAVDEHTLFHGASLSKPVNAVTVLTFVQNGKLDLAKDVNEQLTGWKLPSSDFPNTPTISLRRLLSHTAGISLRVFGTGFPADQPMPSLLDVLNGKPPATQPVKIVEPPGKRFYYSGGAIAISQLMLEESAKQPYPTIVKKAVFDPLAMTESTFEQTLSAEQLKHAAPGFKAGKRVNGPDRVYPAMAAAGLWTTPEDYAKLVVEIQHAAAGEPAKVLSPAAVLEMMTPYIANAKSASPRSSSVGLGVFLAGKGPSRTFFHAGSHAGYSCYMIGRFEAGQGVVVMTNGDDAFDLIAEIVQTVGTEYGWPDYQFIPPARAAKPATVSGQ